MNNFIRTVIQFFLRLFGNKAPGTTTGKQTVIVPPEPQPKASVDDQPKEEIKDTPAEEPTPEPAPAPKPASPSMGKELTHTVIKENSKEIHVVTDGNVEGRFPMFVRKSWQGLFTSGKLEIKDFIQSDGAMLEDLDMTKSSINVMSAVSDNEGKLEAINAYDGAFLSFGIFQWTLGTRDSEGELPALLKRVKDAFPDTFQTYFGQFGMDVHPETKRTYGYLTLDGKKLKPRNEKKLLKNWDWVYRFWRAGLDKNVQAVQIQHALGRLNNFYGKQKAHGFTLNQIITSEFGVGLLLDNHVNLPDFPWRCIEMAMTRTGLTNPTDWKTEQERQVLEEYLRIRQAFTHTYGSGQTVGPMFDAKKRGETTRRYVSRGLISDERNSFQFMNISSRDAANLNEVLMPEDLSAEDYPEIRMEFMEEGED